MGAGRTVDVPGEDGGIVISITTRRGYRWRGAECQHAQVLIDPQFSELECQTCQRKLNPIEWLSWLAQNWSDVQQMYQAARQEQARLPIRRRVKCDHCGSMARVTASDADERRRQASETARYREALEAIAEMQGNAIGDRAQRAARAALIRMEGE